MADLSRLEKLQIVDDNSKIPCDYYGSHSRSHSRTERRGCMSSSSSSSVGGFESAAASGAKPTYYYSVAAQDLNNSKFMSLNSVNSKHVAASSFTTNSRNDDDDIHHTTTTTTIGDYDYYSNQEGSSSSSNTNKTNSSNNQKRKDSYIMSAAAAVEFDTPSTATNTSTTKSECQRNSKRLKTSEFTSSTKSARESAQRELGSASGGTAIEIRLSSSDLCDAGKRETNRSSSSTSRVDKAGCPRALATVAGTGGDSRSGRGVPSSYSYYQDSNDNSSSRSINRSSSRGSSSNSSSSSRIGKSESSRVWNNESRNNESRNNESTIADNSSSRNNNSNRINSSVNVNCSNSSCGDSVISGGAVISAVFLSKKQRELMKKREEEERRAAEKQREAELYRKKRELEQEVLTIGDNSNSNSKRRGGSDNSNSNNSNSNSNSRDEYRGDSSRYHNSSSSSSMNDSINNSSSISSSRYGSISGRYSSKDQVQQQQRDGASSSSSSSSTSSLSNQNCNNQDKRSGGQHSNNSNSNATSNSADGGSSSSRGEGRNSGGAAAAAAAANVRDVQKAWDETTESNLADLQLFKLEDLKLCSNRKDLEQIREHYLGLKKEKKKIQKPSEKFRNIFNFEWNANEDTAREDNNDLYLSKLEPQLLFGRGFRAGIDVREQRKHNNFYDELIKKRMINMPGGDLPLTSVLDSRKAKQALIKSRDIEQGDKNSVHWSDKNKDEMTERDWRIFREDYEIYIKGGRVPAPARNWSETGLPDELLQAVRSCGYDRPTPIQMQAIPIALDQRDMIGIAETGSGKTAAFVLPMLTYVKGLPLLDDETSQDGPYALILAPSRELALQIEDETKKFACFCKCRTVAIVGGRSAEVQAFELRRGVEIVIGTPGRIKDCLEKSYTVLSQCNYVVLDEADRMIDLGFEEVVNWILDQIPSSNLKSEDESQAYQQELEAKAGYRQYRLTQMFSATMPTAVERLSRKYLKAPAFISIGDPGGGKRAIEQRLEFVAEGKKRQRLEQILRDAEGPIMVFVNQKKVADVIAKTLQKMGFSAASLHGGKAQELREQSLHDFKKGTVDILVATDVAGRGIDVEDVQLVVNFDMPKEIANYTHRIGRTGRAGKRGTAVSFVTEEDSGLFYDLKQLLISTNNVIPYELSSHPSSKIKPNTNPNTMPL